jgi:hypothetical protein
MFLLLHLWTRPRHHTIMRMLQKESRLVPGQEIHKVRCLTMLEYFKKLIWHNNSWGFHVPCSMFHVPCSMFHVRSELKWNTSKIQIFLSPSFSWRNLRHASFETLKCLHNILHERKGRSGMSSAITCLKSELVGIPDRRLSPSFVLPCRKCVRHFFTAEIWSASSSYMLVCFISIFLALKLLRVKIRTIAHCSLLIAHCSLLIAPSGTFLCVRLRKWSAT